VNNLLIDSFWKDSDASYRDTIANFEFIQGVAHAVEHYETNDSNLFLEMTSRINTYFDSVKSLSISDVLVSRSNYKRPTVIKFLFLIIGLPIALVSLILFVLPYQLTKRIFINKLNPLISPDDETSEGLNTAFTGTLIFGAGSLIFILWTIILTVVIGLLTASWLGALGTLVLTYPIFRFSLYYAKHAVRYRDFVRGEKRINKQREAVEKLRDDRAQIVKDLGKIREEYASQQLEEV